MAARTKAKTSETGPKTPKTKPAVAERKPRETKKADFASQISQSASWLKSRATALTRNKKSMTLIVVTLVLIGVGYWFHRNFVFAWVGATPLTKLVIYDRLDKKYGTQEEERLISETLVLNEARKRKVTFAENEISDQLKKYEDQQGGASQLDEALKMQSMTRDDLRDQIKFAGLIEKMFGSDVKIDDQEISDYLEQNKDQFPPVADKNSSESAQINQYVTETLKKQKVNQAFSDWLKQAQESPEIKRFN